MRKWWDWVDEIMKDGKARLAKEISGMLIDRGYKLTPSPTAIAGYMSRSKKYVGQQANSPQHRNIWKKVEA